MTTFTIKWTERIAKTAYVDCEDEADAREFFQRFKEGDQGAATEMCDCIVEVGGLGDEPILELIERM